MKMYGTKRRVFGLVIVAAVIVFLLWLWWFSSYTQGVLAARVLVPQTAPSPAADVRNQLETIITQFQKNFDNLTPSPSSP